MAEHTFVVTGVGMYTPVGARAPATCAALRAGISRVRPWPHFSFGDEPVNVGAVAADGRDASWCEKAVPITRGPIYEALWQAGLYSYDWHGRRVGLYFSTPPRRRTGVLPEFYSDFGAYLGDLWDELAGNDQIYRVEHAHVGGAVALAAACEALATGELDAAVVAGFESALDSPYLDELLAQGRLHTADRSGGIIPGEGAAAFVLETAAGARGRQAAALAQVVAVALEQEAAGWSPSLPSQAGALSRALQTALAVPPGASEYRRLMVDHTGERWRVREWALAEPRALGGLPLGWQLWHPVDCVGDLGAAFVPFAVAWAATEFTRRDAEPGGTIVGAMNDAGERAVLTLMPR
ncbi:beta-ketoacyl synthase N-terminal-like domain-containing protein [Nannocystis pusilla]|uniref:beta-ketoacyl synthase N-terminal-like domain-containing protein n=1 Tax=Nannocystis pusilla TaxID=889268 RepID=UPI003DA2463C